MKHIKIYCDDLDKAIDEDGCYDAKGSTLCKTCLVKPTPEKVNTNRRNKKKVNRYQDYR